MDDFAEVRRLLAEAARAARADLRVEEPDGQFYAFAFSGPDDGNSTCAAANSEQRYHALLARRRERIAQGKGRGLGPPEAPTYRWNPAEWGYEGSGPEHFEPANLLLEELSSAASEEDRFHEFRAHSFMAQIGALCDLDRAGVFGTGAERDRVTVFVTVSDSRDGLWLEWESARLANPPGVFAAFEREWLAPQLKADTTGPSLAVPADVREWQDRQGLQRYEGPSVREPWGVTYDLFMKLVGSWDQEANSSGTANRSTKRFPGS